MLGAIMKKRLPSSHRRPSENVPKLEWPPSPLLSPVPVVMATCPNPRGHPNIITLAWVGTICTDPPLVALSIRPERFSHDLVRDSGEVVLNMPSARLVAAVDRCGVLSGREVNKWEATGLTPIPASKVAAPLIAECPLHLECRVCRHSREGSHTLFLAQILAVRVNPGLIDRKGRLAIEKAGLIAYAHGHYYALGRQLGSFGFSVRRRRRHPSWRKDDRS